MGIRITVVFLFGKQTARTLSVGKREIFSDISIVGTVPKECAVVNTLCVYIPVQVPGNSGRSPSVAPFLPLPSYSSN